MAMVIDAMYGVVQFMAFPAIRMQAEATEMHVRMVWCNCTEVSAQFPQQCPGVSPLIKEQRQGGKFSLSAAYRM
jgi:hypothetical protein